MAGFFMKSTNKKKSLKRKSRDIVKPKKKDIVASDDDESIVSGDEDNKDEQNDDNESDVETAQEKRLRLAKEYISHIEKEEQEKQEVEDIDRDAIAHRLQQDVLEDAGRLQKFVADTIEVEHEKKKILRGHQLSVTSVVISSDNKYAYSSSKDGAIIKWDVVSGDKLIKISGKSKHDKSQRKCHQGQVLCLALSTDSKYLASGGSDDVIHIWNPQTMEWIHTFKGHRKKISSLTFRRRSHQLLSSSDDKTIKVWSLDEMAYVETLFGHEDSVLSVDSLYRDRALSCGGRDRSVRLWKIPEESQLVFQSTTASSFDCVTMLNEEYFLAGADDGSLSIFFVRKKKPITLRTNAHRGNDGVTNESWVSAVSSLPFTDLAASGANDGIKLWKCEKSFRSIQPIHTINITGFVNDLKFSENGEYLIAGVGQEHRLGRWWRRKEAKNSVVLIPLRKRESAET